MKFILIKVWPLKSMVKLSLTNMESGWDLTEASFKEILNFHLNLFKAFLQAHAPQRFYIAGKLKHMRKKELILSHRRNLNQS